MEESNMLMTTITIQDLQDNFDDYLEKAHGGQTFAITSDGEILAYLGPHKEKEKYKLSKSTRSKDKSRNLGDDLPF